MRLMALILDCRATPASTAGSGVASAPPTVWVLAECGRSCWPLTEGGTPELLREWWPEACGAGVDGAGSADRARRLRAAGGGFASVPLAPAEGVTRCAALGGREEPAAGGLSSAFLDGESCCCGAAGAAAAVVEAPEPARWLLALNSEEKRPRMDPPSLGDSGSGAAAREELPDGPAAAAAAAEAARTLLAVLGLSWAPTSGGGEPEGRGADRL